jgi:thioredoxin reductase (NADPH)
MPTPKPVLFGVDDDPEVLAALERDLKARYGDEYEITTSSAPHEALQLADQLQREGRPVAVFVVDRQMADMTGIEFIRAAAKIHPLAKRVLLTADADAEVAIQGINEVRLDYYLHKPWTPAEEVLYPALDRLLADWKSKAPAAFEGIRVLGSSWSARCFDVKDFLFKNNIPYQWIEIENDPAMKQLSISVGGDPPKLPVVLFPDGSQLVCPTNSELAAKVGIPTRPRLRTYEVVIVGGGPAGLAAAVYGASEGLRTLLVEREAIGGQAVTSPRIENYLGFPAGISGVELARLATTQAAKFGAELVGAQEAVKLRCDDSYRMVGMADGSEVSTRVVLLAMGVSVRRLEVPGADIFPGAGLYYGSALSDAATYRDQDVCVVGGANSAGQGSLFLSKYARTVTLLTRSDSLRREMSQYLVERIEQIPKIRVMNRVEVVALEGRDKVERVRIRNLDTGEETEMATAAVFVFIGALPRTDLVAGLVERDEKGYILTGTDLPRENDRPRGWRLQREPHLYETNVPGIFAVGDVRAGSGKRVAAAVGEGAAAVMMVHRYLDTV